jgi:hypothetical protein
MSGCGPACPVAEPAPPSLPRRLSGGTIALIAIGLLILVPSGLCSAILGVGFLSDIIGRGEAAQFSRSLIWLVPLFGGPPMLIGAGLLAWGLKRRRSEP